MKKRINLTIKGCLIERMKKYADLRETSISSIVEEHFQKLLAPKPQLQKPSLLEFVKGLPKSKIDYPQNFDFKKEYYSTKSLEYDGENPV